MRQNSDKEVNHRQRRQSTITHKHAHSFFISKTILWEDIRVEKVFQYISTYNTSHGIRNNNIIMYMCMCRSSVGRHQKLSHMETPEHVRLQEIYCGVTSLKLIQLTAQCIAFSPVQYICECMCGCLTGTRFLRRCLDRPVDGQSEAHKPHNRAKQQQQRRAYLQYEYMHIHVHRYLQGE